MDSRRQEKTREASEKAIDTVHGVTGARDSALSMTTCDR